MLSNTYARFVNYSIPAKLPATAAPRIRSILAQNQKVSIIWTNQIRFLPNLCSIFCSFICVNLQISWNNSSISAEISGIRTEDYLSSITNTKSEYV